MINYEVQDEWFERALDYALKSWSSTFNRMGKPNPYVRIEKIIVGLVAESAVEHLFNEMGIPFSQTGKTRWYEADRYDIGVGEYAIDVKASLLDTSSNYIQMKFANLFQSKDDWFKECYGLVPLDQFNPAKSERRKLKKEKAYLFPFVEGHFSENYGSDALVHAFWDYRWLKRAEYKDLDSLGYLKLSYKGTPGVGKIRIYGTREPRQLVVEDIDLDKPRIITKNSYHSVISLRYFGGMPDGKLTINSPSLGLREVIENKMSFELGPKTENGYDHPSNHWQNVRLLDGIVHFVAWALEEDMRLFGTKIKRFAKHVPQYSETKVDNWGCPMSDLNEIETLKDLI